MVTMGVLVIMGGDTVGGRVPVEVDEGWVIMEVAVGLIPRSVLPVELQAVVKNNNKVIKKMDNDVSFFTSISMSRLVGLNLSDYMHSIFTWSVMIGIVLYPNQFSLSWFDGKTQAGMEGN